MSQILQDFSAQYCKAKVPVLKPGYLVKVHQKIKEGNKERTQVFQGTVMKIGSGYGTDNSFTVRKISEGVGVDRIFPIHSPNIIKIDVVRAHKVRRSNLNYLRDLSGKALRMKEVELDLEYKEFEKPTDNSQQSTDNSEAEAAQEADPVEAPEAEAKPVEEAAEAPAEPAEAPKEEEKAEATEEPPAEEGEKKEA